MSGSSCDRARTEYDQDQVLLHKRSCTGHRIGEIGCPVNTRQGPLGASDGVRRTRESVSFMDPDRGDVSVDVAEIYDAAAQVTRGTSFLSTNAQPDFVVAQLEIRSIFPQELLLIISLGGLRLVERSGDWSGRQFADASLQLCICESA